MRNQAQLSVVIKDKSGHQKMDRLKYVNQILCGDCLNLLARLPDSSIDLVLTSPPYYKQRDYNGLGTGSETGVAEYIDTLIEVFDECIRILKPTGNIVYNIGDKYLNGSLSLIPYRFAIKVLNSRKVKLTNEVTWVKSNPTPRQFKRRLVSSTEPFFHFVKSENYFYDRDSFLKDEKKRSHYSTPVNIGNRYRTLINGSKLSPDQKKQAHEELTKVIEDVKSMKIKSFRMKIKDIHAMPFGGQEGGRKIQIEKKGFTIIRINGEAMKRDVIETPVETIKGNIHPAVFPRKVVKEFISLLAPVGGIVLDPYIGSGTTAIVAKSMDRDYVGIDINPDYCNYAIERLTNELF